MELFVAVLLGATLVWSGAAKLRAPAAAASGLRTFGLPGRAALVVALAVTEIGLGATVATGAWWQASAAAACLLGVFAVALAVALRRGGGGAPCACFGARSRLSGLAVGRGAALACGFAVLAVGQARDAGTQTWTAIVASTALLGVGVMGVLLMGLAREVAALRMRLGPQMALELEGEGPDLGDRHAALAMHDADRLHVAVFTSEGCAMCHALAPAVDEVARDPGLVVSRLDEHREAGTWRDLAIPGSPYAVVSDHDGVALSKGTFNSLGQLDALIAAARVRREPARA